MRIERAIEFVEGLLDLVRDQQGRVIGIRAGGRLVVQITRDGQGNITRLEARSSDGTWVTILPVAGPLRDPYILTIHGFSGRIVIDNNGNMTLVEPRSSIFEREEDLRRRPISVDDLINEANRTRPRGPRPPQRRGRNNQASRQQANRQVTRLEQSSESQSRGRSSNPSNASHRSPIQEGWGLLLKAEIDLRKGQVRKAYETTLQALALLESHPGLQSRDDYKRLMNRLLSLLRRIIAPYRIRTVQEDSHTRQSRNYLNQVFK